MSVAVYLLGDAVLPAMSFDHPMLDGLSSRIHAVTRPASALLLMAATLSGLRAQWLRHDRRQLLHNQTGIETIRALSWSRFEHLVGEMYRQQGFEVREQGGAGADEGIDLVLQRNGQCTLVQCKHWRSKRIGVSIVREHLGVVTARKADHGVIVCTGTFTQPAIEFAQANGIELMDGMALTSLTKPPPPSTEPPQAESSPVCPTCGSAMVERRARRGANAGQSFLGCSQFPRCRATRILST